MIIEIEKVKELVAQADKILITSEAEKPILQLLKMQKEIEEALKLAKQMIEEKAKELNINFKSITANNLKVSYRQYGAKYRVDTNFLELLPKNFYKVTSRYDAIAEEVDKWTDEHKGLPAGINEVERPKSLSFSIKGDNQNE